jgi:hypothetical protein
MNGPASRASRKEALPMLFLVKHRYPVLGAVLSAPAAPT